MKKKDPFEELLMKCLEEDGQQQTLGKKIARGGRPGRLVNCASCNEMIFENYRYCPNCGDTTMDTSNGDIPGFDPLVIKKKMFRISIVGLDKDFHHNGQYFTKLTLRVENLTDERLHLSLTFVDSVIINQHGRQYTPVDYDDFDIPKLFESWFYLYPNAYREGVIIFPEIPDRIKSVYISCNPQNTDEEELFHFVIE